jgi:hypothetical protein
MKRSNNESPTEKHEQFESPIGDPYALLAEFGVTDESSMADVHRAGLSAQRAGALTRERSQAWRDLRDPEKRLAIDLFRFQSDPQVFGGVALTEPDRWDLLGEVVESPAEPLGPLPLPSSFLEDTK